MIWSSYKNFSNSKSRHKLTLRFATKSFSKSHKRIKRIDTRSTPGRIGLPPKPGRTTTLGGIGCFHCTDLHFRMSNILRNYSIFLQISLEESTFLRTSLSFSNNETPPNSPVTPTRNTHKSSDPRHDRQWRETDCVRSASPRRAAKWN